jgi:tetratricopeptide (TPR) repeat protein
MNHDEALQLLGLSGSPDSGAILAAYSSRAAELSQRAAAAPTPSLRETYQQQAAPLLEARDLLLDRGGPRENSSPLSLTKQLDLPARTPITTGLGAHAGPEAGGTAFSITPGQVLADRYEILAHLGSGGMGQVFAALDRLREEEIAIKVLLPHLLADPKARERFLDEARIASNLSHPNIIRVFDVQQTAGLTFLTMERLRGRSLREEIVRHQQTAERFSVAETRGIAEQLCQALQYAHRFTVHRDVKPENIWLDEDGAVKLMDFGIARLLRPSQFTSTGLALGTAYYMAPEQVRGQEVDHRADQFAAGVVLYELLTGEIPQGVIRPPHQLRRSVPAGMSQAVMKALEARPEARHADMAALGGALAARSKGAVITRVSLAAVVAVLVGAAMTFPSWKPWVLDRNGAEQVEEGRTPSLVQKRLAPTVEEKGAEEAYRKAWSQVDALKKQAETVGSQIESEAAKSRDEVAEEVLELWRRHSQRSEWLVQAEKALSSAERSAGKRSFDEAGIDLKAAETEFSKIRRWRDNARHALESIDKTRAALEEKVSRMNDPPAALLNWPMKLQAEVREGLVRGDGEEGLAMARRFAAAIPEVDGVIAERREVAKSLRSGHTLSRIPGSKGRFDALDAAAQEAAQSLVQARIGDARRLYRKAAELGRSATTQAIDSLTAMIARGDKALQAGKVDEALSEFEQVLAINTPGAQTPGMTDSEGMTQLGPILSQAYRGRAEVSLGKKQYDRAIADCDEAVRIDPKNAMAYMNRGDAYGRKGDHERALADCSEAVRIDPQNPSAYNRRGYVHHEKKDYDQAIADFTEAIRLDVKSVRSYVSRGNSYGKKGDQDRAIADFTEAIRLDPKNAPAYYLRGAAFDEKGNFDRAIADCDQAIRLDPKSAWAYKYRGGAYFSKGDFNRALADITEAIRLDPKNAVFFTNRGQTYVAKREFDGAILDFSEAIRLDPKNASAYIGRGDAYGPEGDQDRAIADFSEAIRLDPKNARAYFYRGRSYSVKKDYNRAIADITEAIRLDPKKASAYIYRGQAYHWKKEDNRAIADFTEAIRIDPRNDRAYEGRGNSYYWEKDYDRAIADFNEAIRIDPRNEMAYEGLAWTYLSQENPDAALTQCARLLRLEPNNKIAYIIRGHAYQDKKHYGLAIAEFSTAIRLDPKDGRSYKARAVAHQQNGDSESARADYDEAARLGVARP